MEEWKERNFPTQTDAKPNNKKKSYSFDIENNHHVINAFVFILFENLHQSVMRWPR